jgi:hypothetical protein
MIRYLTFWRFGGGGGAPAGAGGEWMTRVRRRTLRR